MMGAPGDRGELGHIGGDIICRRSPIARIARAEGANVGDVMVDDSGAGRIEADLPSPESRLYGDGDGDGEGPGELSMRALAMPEADG